jgi:splicing factor 3B subunit 5
MDRQIDKITFQQMDTLHSKFLGTGNSDTTRHEWLSHLGRDALALYSAHPSLKDYLAIGLNEHPKRLEFMLLQAMIQPLKSGPHNPQKL